MGVSRTRVLSFSLESLSVITNLFPCFLFCRYDRQLSWTFALTTIKGISNYARKINHRWRIKVIKFVNSTVKCNVNIFILQNLSTLETIFCKIVYNESGRLWNESSNFMQQRIKSDLVISHPYGNFLIFFFSFSAIFHHVAFDICDKCR